MTTPMGNDELIARLRWLIGDSRGGKVEMQRETARTILSALESRPAPTEEREVIAYLSRHPDFGEEIHEMPSSPADIAEGWVDYPLVILATDTTPSRDEEGSVDREAVLREIWLEAHETIPRDGKDAAFAALGRILQITSRALKTSTPETQTVEGGGQGTGHPGLDTENAAWAWLDKKFGTPSDDPVDRAYDASEMVDAFHAGKAHRRPTPPERARVLEEALRPMSSAPRDRTFILARFRVPDDHAQARFNGRWFSIFHEGVTPSGFDLGWALYPGYGGVPDDHFDGWMPCPDAALSASPTEVVEGKD